MKRTIDLHSFLSTDIKVGDIVNIRDGSSITYVDDTGYYELYIVYAYPDLTDSYKELKDIDCEVIEIGVTDKICIGDHSWSYLQDIVIKIGKGHFRVSSNHVKKLNRESNLNILLNESIL